MASGESSSDSPDFYYGSLTREQWKTIVSALVELDTEEARILAYDITRFILPPCDT